MNNKGHEDLKSNYLKVYLSLFLILAIYLIFALGSIKTFLRGDEIDFVLAAKGITLTGIPKYSGMLLPNELFSLHPPLYLYLLALVFRLFGVSEVSVRLVGILCALGNIVLVYFIAQELFKERKDFWIIAGLASFMFAINPLVIQGSSVVDIDNTVLTLTISLFLFCFVKTYRRPRLLRVLILGLLFGLSLWAKLPTPPLLIVSIVLFYWLKGDLREGLSLALGIGLLGGLLFLVTFGLYSYFFNFPFLQPFLYLPGRLLTEYGRTFYSIRQSALLILGRLYILFFYLSPSLALLAVLACYFRARKWLKQVGSELVDFFAIFSGLIFVVYTFVGSTAWGFPRFYLPMLPGLSVVVAYFLVDNFAYVTRKEALLYLSMLALLTLYFLFIVGDPLLLPFPPKRSFLFQSGIVRLIVSKASCFSSLYLLSLVFAIVVFKCVARRISAIGLVALAGVVTLAASNLSLNILQSRACYSTRYIYGEKGMEQTISYLKKRVSQSDLVICDSEIAYYLGTKRRIGKFYLIDTRVLFRPASFRQLARQSKIGFVVIRKTDVAYSPQFGEIKSLMKKRWMLDRKFGNFEIYKVKNSRFN